MKARMISLGCPEEKLHVIRIGVEGLDGSMAIVPVQGAFRILMAARFCEKKGFVDGLKACRIAAGRGMDIQVTIVGDAVPGDASGEAIKGALLELAATPELSGRVRFAGFVKPAVLSELLTTHDCFLCPSLHAANGDAEGGSPVILTQAMGRGLLGVGCRHCDIPELIVHGETGWLADSGDVEGLAVGLEMAVLQPEKCLAMRLAGREHVLRSFTLEGQLTGLSDLYAQLIGSIR